MGQGPVSQAIPGAIKGATGFDPDAVRTTTPGNMMIRGAASALPFAPLGLGEAGMGALDAIANGAKATLGAAGSGAASGAGQFAGQALAPTGNIPGTSIPYKEAAGTAGSLLGGAAGAATFHGTTTGAGALAEGWRGGKGTPEQQAVARVGELSSNPDALKASLANLRQNPDAAQVVPGSQPTLGQMAPDTGIANAETVYRNAYPGTFQDVDRQQNAARVGALTGAERQDVGAQTVGQAFRAQLDQINDAHAAATKAAADMAAGTLAAVGGQTTAEQAGAAGRSAIEGQWAPRFAAQDQAEQAARAHLANTIDQMGGNEVANTDAQTAAQVRGEAARGFMRQASDQAAQANDALWNTLRQHGNLTFDPAPIKAAAQGILAEPELKAPGGGLSVEAPIVNGWAGWDQPLTLDQLRGGRSNVSSDLDMAARAGNRQAARRLTAIRNAIDDTLENGVDTAVADEQSASPSGHSQLAAEIRAWQSAPAGQRHLVFANGADSGNGAIGPGPAASMSGVAGAERSAGQSQGQTQGVPGLPPDDGLEVGDLYAQARASNREFRSTYSEGPVGNVLESGPFGGGHEVGSSQVIPTVFHGGTGSAEDIQALIKAVGRDQALGIVEHQAAADLKGAALRPDGTWNQTAWRGWMKRNNGNLSPFPELQARFGNPALAQQEIDKLAASRKALDAAYPLRGNQTNAGIVAKGWQRGQAGAEAYRGYKAAVGSDPAAMAQMRDYVAFDFRNAAVRNGEVKPGLAEAWRRAHASALSEEPELAKQFDTAAHAQEALTAAEARHAEALKDYQNSAAGKWLGADPEKAVGQIIGKPNSKQLAVDLSRRVASDPDAQAGLRRTFLDDLLNRSKTSVPGEDGGMSLASATFRKNLAKDRGVYQVIFTPRQMQVLDNVAADLDRQQSTIGATAPKVGPGTARDTLALRKLEEKEPSLFGAITGGLTSIAAMTVGEHASGIGGAYFGKKAIDALGDIRESMRARRINKVNDLIAEMIAKPQVAAAMFERVKPSTVTTLPQRVVRALARSAPVTMQAENGQ
jgi:hypothetical protein